MKIIDAIPETLTETTTIRVEDPPDVPGVRLLHVDGGFAAVEIRPVDADERAMVVDAPYRADWLGWHRGQPGAYGRTPAAALRRLLDGRLS